MHKGYDFGYFCPASITILLLQLIGTLVELFITAPFWLLNKRSSGYGDHQLEVPAESEAAFEYVVQ